CRREWFLTAACRLCPSLCATRSNRSSAGRSARTPLRPGADGDSCVAPRSLSASGARSFLGNADVTQIGENACLFALLLEALEGTLEVFIVVDDDFRQVMSSPMVASTSLLSVQAATSYGIP